jgi:uncharacterized membrane protein
MEGNMKKLFFFMVLLGLLVFLFPTTVLALGVALGPSTLELTNALRGTEYERTLTIFNPSTADTHFNLSADGQAQSWLNFYGLDNEQQSITGIDIAGESSAYVLLKVDIPSNAPNGTYTATIYAATAPVAASGNGVSTIMQAQSSVTIDVTGDQVIAGTVNSVTVNSPEAGMPMRLVVNFENTGNVSTVPNIDCVIYNGNVKVAEISNDTTTVAPQAEENIQTEWATTTTDQTGDYTGQVTVSLGNTVLDTQDVAFTLSPPGTFTEVGNLTNLDYLGKPLLNTVVTIQAGFQNTGVADTLVTFTGQVYLGANLINVINSQSTIVPAGQLGTIISYLKLSQTGNYTIKGYISYAGKQTVTKVITINVGGSGKMSYLLYIITGVLVIIAISAGTFIILRKTRKHPPEKAP